MKSIELYVHTSEVVSILGSNGAGKTTLLRTLIGILRPRNGKIIFCGISIEKMEPNNIIRKGIAGVLEGRELFETMSVYDNLLLGIYSLNWKERKKILSERMDMIFLFPILKERLKQRADTLSGGQQQMLAIGRALMANPKLLFLDEPSLGLSPLLVIEMMSMLSKIVNEWGIYLLLVEQNARAALRIANFVYILERGEVVFKGRSENFITSPVIKRAYLGG